MRGSRRPGTPRLYKCAVPGARDRRACTNARLRPPGNAALVQMRGSRRAGTPRLYKCVAPAARERRACTNAWFPGDQDRRACTNAWFPATRIAALVQMRGSPATRIAALVEMRRSLTPNMPSLARSSGCRSALPGEDRARRRLGEHRPGGDRAHDRIVVGAGRRQQAPERPVVLVSPLPQPEGVQAAGIWLARQPRRRLRVGVVVRGPVRAG